MFFYLPLEGSESEGQSEIYWNKTPCGQLHHFVGKDYSASIPEFLITYLVYVSLSPQESSSNIPGKGRCPRCSPATP